MHRALKFHRKFLKEKWPNISSGTAVPGYIRSLTPCWCWSAAPAAADMTLHWAAVITLRAPSLVESARSSVVLHKTWRLLSAGNRSGETWRYRRISERLHAPLLPRQQSQWNNSHHHIIWQNEHSTHIITSSLLCLVSNFHWSKNQRIGIRLHTSGFYYLKQTCRLDRELTLSSFLWRCYSFMCLEHFTVRLVYIAAMCQTLLSKDVGLKA